MKTCPRAKAEESEVAGRHEKGGQKDHKCATLIGGEQRLLIRNNTWTEPCKFC